MQKGIIDRFEGDFALIEINGEVHDYPRHLLPADAREGDAVIIEGNRVSIDRKATAELRKRIEKLMEDVWED